MPRSRVLPAVLLLLAALTAISCVPMSPTGTDSGRADPAGPASSDEASRLAREIHELVNRERAQRGLPQLAWNAELAQIAAGHSRDMAERSYFSHINRQGQDPSERARRAGFECEKTSGNTRTFGVAENIFMASLYHRYSIRTSPGGQQTRTYEWKTIADMARETVQSWMSSPGHRANLLNASYEAEGIGVAMSSGNEFYVTQNFC